MKQREIIARSFRFRKNMRYIAKLFSKENLEILFIKGLSYINEKEFRVNRTFADIDILIEKENLRKAVKILEKEGFVIDKTNHSIKYAIKYTHHLELLNFEKNIFIELHFRITKKYSHYNPKTSELIERKVLKKFEDYNYFVPSDEDNFLIYVLQLFHGDYLARQGNNKNLFAINYILKNKKLDWNLLIKLAYRYKMDHLLFLLRDYLKYKKKMIYMRIPKIKVKNKTFPKWLYLTLRSLKLKFNFHYYIGINDMIVNPFKYKFKTFKRWIAK